jgi:hypothetical protein
VDGEAALAIVADGRIEIRGTLSLAGGTSLSSLNAGPGEYPSCPAGDGILVGSLAAGSGGGGFGTMGGSGGDAITSGGTQTGGAGGSVTGNAALVPLRGGCPGGLITNGVVGSTGRGGGAVQLSSRTEIALVLGSDGGNITVAGGAGSFRGENAGLRAGTGAGSGGAILLEAPSVTADNGSGLTANGGSGGCQGMVGSPGQLSLSGVGGADCNSITYGDGGTGGAVSSPAGQDGEDGDDTSTAVGGGGGGGMGRIRINTAAGTFTPAGSAIISPTPSVGSAGRR